jgi:hypothetical protein
MQPRVGEDIVTACGKCKQRTTHVVFAMEGPAVKRVQCKICLSYHNYHPDPEERQRAKPQPTSAALRRRPGTEGEVKTLRVDDDAAPRPAPDLEPAAPRAAKAPARRTRKEPAAPDYSELWTQAMHGKDPETMIAYRPDLNYEEGALVDHPNFGVGVITRVSPLPEKRMQVLFRDGFKTLVCRFGAAR